MPRKLGKKCVLDLLGTPKRIAESLARHSQDAAYFDTNLRQLEEHYPDMYVAVYEKKVVGTGRNLHGLVEDLRELGVDTSVVYVNRTYVNETRSAFILPSVA